MKCVPPSLTCPLPCCPFFSPFPQNVAGTYFGFAAVGVIALATINAIVPETKGKTLEDIEKLWTPDTAGGSGGGGGGGSGPGHFD